MRVLIKCPTTGKAIDTKLDFDESSFAQSTFNQSSIDCPECGQTHTWGKKDAWLDWRQPRTS